jgi:hypothetical protein
MSIKPFIFFGIIFAIILYGYFNYDSFLTYFPIHILIKCIVLVLGIGAIFAPQIINKLKNGDNIDDIKSFMIKKYGAK